MKKTEEKSNNRKKNKAKKKTRQQIRTAKLTKSQKRAATEGVMTRKIKRLKTANKKLENRVRSLMADNKVYAEELRSML